MEIHTSDDLLAAHDASGKLYHEFLRKSSMSAGIYRLPAGGHDPQQPHNEDEIYYVISGMSSVTVSGEESEVVPGTIIFVAKGEPHYFHDILEDLTLLVLFAPAESG
jgi:mannose-6-phosphate isomerase-like protein (cupin superfamily)